MLLRHVDDLHVAPSRGSGVAVTGWWTTIVQFVLTLALLVMVLQRFSIREAAWMRTTTRTSDGLSLYRW